MFRVGSLLPSFAKAKLAGHMLPFPPRHAALHSDNVTFIEMKNKTPSLLNENTQAASKPLEKSLKNFLIFSS